MDKYVLMLEDDKDDRSLVKETLSELVIDVPLRFFSSSEDLFEYLSQADRPSLILLDDNSTPDDGMTVLRKLKADARYQEIPVVILSENDLPSARKESYLLGASSFIKKTRQPRRNKEKDRIVFYLLAGSCGTVKKNKVGLKLIVETHSPRRFVDIEIVT